MPRYDFRSPRLFVDAPLGAGAVVPLAREQAHYLGNVLRLGPGDAVLAFNGRDGEWQATLAGGKKPSGLTVAEQTRTQPAAGEVTKINAAQNKITLKHGPITNLDMGAMTMVFTVADPAMLGAVKVGDKVTFEADRVKGKLTVVTLTAAN